MISASDEFSVYQSISTWLALDPDTKENVYQINTHTYQNGGAKTLSQIALRDGKRLCMSEVCHCGNENGVGHDHNAMKAPLQLSIGIARDLNELKPISWIYWQAIENEPGTIKQNGNWGLIHLDFAGEKEEWHITKSYWAFAHYTRFIRPGSLMLNVSSNCIPSQTNLVAAFCDSQLVLVMTNATDVPQIMSLDLSSFIQLEAPTIIGFMTNSEHSLGIFLFKIRAFNFAPRIIFL